MKGFPRPLGVWLACIAGGIAVLLWLAPPLWLALTACTLICVLPGLLLLKAEHAAHAATQRFFQNVLDVIPEPLYLKNANSQYIMINDAFVRDKGMPREKLIGSNGITTNYEAASLRAQKEDRAVIAGEPVWKEEHRNHFQTGKELFRIVAKNSCLGRNNEPIVVGAHFDITELRLAQRELSIAADREREQRERVQKFTQRLIDVIPQPVYVKDAQSRYIMVNESFARDLQRTATEMIGANPTMFTNDQTHIDNVYAEDQRVLAGEVILKEEKRRHSVTGLEVYRLISKHSSIDAAGQPVIVGTNFNITSWREAEERAARASEAKSVFLASMSHEIRTPLGGVIGMLRIALRKEELSASVRDTLMICQASADHLLTIINDILDFSKIEAGQLSLENIDFDVRSTLSDALAVFHEHAQARDLKFQLEVDPDLPAALRGDPTRLRQIVVNLVGNAMKFTERGEVCVRMQSVTRSAERCTVRFIVEDTGIGISAEALPRMFQQFQQADSSTTRKYGGTGLGLVICRQLVEAMGGKISVESTVGVGSRFIFELPMPIGRSIDKLEMSTLDQHVRALRILCAEDSPTNQLIIQNLLEEMGHHVDIVEDGLDAIAALAQRNYDLVLMDGRMPRMDGSDAARAIRAGGLNGQKVLDPQIAIIALTANASEEDRQRYLGAGMNDFLSKPIDERKLHAMLAAHIERQTNAGKTPDGRYTPGTPKGDFTARLRAIFDAEVPGRITEIESAIANADYVSLTRQFHSIRGGAYYTGDAQLVTLASVLEAHADQHAMDTVIQLWPDFKTQLENAVAERSSGLNAKA